jgi:hypothetical protein
MRRRRTASRKQHRQSQSGTQRAEESRRIGRRIVEKQQDAVASGQTEIQQSQAVSRSVATQLLVRPAPARTCDRQIGSSSPIQIVKQQR